MSRELITAIVDCEPDMEVVGEAEPGDDIGATAALYDAELVIVGLDGCDLPASVVEVFERRGRLKVIGVPDSVRSAAIHQLRPYQEGVCELARPEEITSAIRIAAGVA